MQSDNGLPPVILVKNERKNLEPLEYSRIRLIRSDENYCHILTCERKITQHSTLDDMQWRCMEYKKLFRIHRFFILHFDCIKEIESRKNGGAVFLKDEYVQLFQRLDIDFFRNTETLPVSPTGLQTLKAVDKPTTMYVQPTLF